MKDDENNPAEAGGATPEAQSSNEQTGARAKDVADSSSGWDPQQTVPSATSVPLPEESGDTSLTTSGFRPWGYRLVRKLGQGGVGEVWEAWQESLGRHIAVKKLRPEHEGSRSTTPQVSRARELLFHHEALTTASLDHPNIAPVYDLTLDELGNPMLAMKLVHGEPWDRILDRDALILNAWDHLTKHISILIDVAQAVAFAHSRGIIHRDLKPSQVMIGEFGEVLLMDWGLALVFDNEKAKHFGLAGAAYATPSPGDASSHPSGTVAYMAPEQTRKGTDGLGPWTDVYLLGATLYFVLTGTPPHSAPDSMGAYNQARKGFVQSPHDRAPNREIPRELEELCRVSMSMDPRNRPATATDFLETLKGFLSGAGKRNESISIVEQLKSQQLSGENDYRLMTGWLNQLARAETLWNENPEIAPVRKNILLDFARAALANKDLTLARIQTERLEHCMERMELLEQIGLEETERRRHSRQRKVLAGAAVVLLGTACYLGARSMLEAKQSRNLQQRAEQAMISAQRERALADSRARETRAEHYISNMRFAQVCLNQGRVDAAHDYLMETPEELRQWEWGFLMNRTFVQLRTLEGHRSGVHSVASSPDGTMAATASSDKTARLWNISTGETIRVLTGHLGVVEDIIFSPDGERVFTCSSDGSIIGWNVADGEPAIVFSGHAQGVLQIRFVHDGSHLVSCSHDGTIRIWDLATMQGRILVSEAQNSLTSIALSSDDQLVAAGCTDRTVRVWDIESGKLVHQLQGHLGPVTCVAFSPAERILASGSNDKTIKLWSIETGREVATLRGHLDGLSWVEYNSTGDKLISASTDRTAMLWHVPSDRRLATLSGHTSYVDCARFTPDGTRILTASMDGTSRLWEAGTTGEFAVLSAGGGAGFLRDVDSPVLTLSSQGVLQVYDSETAQLEGRYPLAEGAGPLSHGFVMSPDGRMLAALGEDGIWWWKHGDSSWRAWERNGNAPTSLAWAPDSKTLRGWNSRGELMNWDPQSQEVTTAHPEVKGDGVFSANGSLLAIRTADSGGVVLKVPGGEVQFQLPGMQHDIKSLHWSPSGRLLATTERNSATSLWDVESGTLKLRAVGERGEVGCVVFSSDERRMLCGYGDGHGQIWDLETGRLMVTLAGHTAGLSTGCFSEDARRVLTGSHDQTAKLWDVASGRELLTLAGHHGTILHAEFRKDGMQVLTASSDDTARLWNAAPWRLDQLPGDESQSVDDRLALWHTQQVKALSQEPVESDQAASVMTTADWYRQCLPDMLAGLEGPLTMQQQAAIAEGTPLTMLVLVPQLHEGKGVFIAGSDVEMAAWQPNQQALEYKRETPCGHAWEGQFHWVAAEFKFTYGLPGEGWDNTQEWPGPPNRTLPDAGACIFRRPTGELLLVAEFGIRPGA